MSTETKQTLRPSPTALLNPRCDAIFKTLFTDNSDAARLALKSFLEAMLNAKVSDVRLISNETAVESEHDKQTIFDITCTLNEKEAVNIEIQGINVAMSYDRRAEYHVAHLLNHFTPKGTQWQEISKVFQISVLNFVYDATTKTPFSIYTMKTDDNRNLSERMSIIFVELPKLAAEHEEAVENLTSAEKWAKFLLYADDETKQTFVEELCKSEDGIMAAQETLLKISQDDINWVRQTSQDMWERDYNSMIAMVEKAKAQIEEATNRGIEQGRAEAQEIIEAQATRIRELEALLAK